jgi:hypothetical protein
MRYAMTPAWVYVMLIVMGVGFMAGAVGFVLWVPAPTGASVGIVWLLMGGGFVFFSLRALRGRRDDERIRREGTAATATLLSAKTTGLIVNGVPQWALRLRIDGAGSPYETTLKLQTYNPPATGATLGVRIDPLRRQHVVLAADGDGAVPAAPGAAAFRLGGDTAPQVEAAIAAALRQAGLGDSGTTSTLNPDGSRTITSTTFSIDGSRPNAAPDAAETVRLLADLDRMHANGTLGDAEFDALKRKLLGET